MDLIVTDDCVQKPAKTPKTATKLKLTTPKAPEEGGKKTPASKAKKASTKKGKVAEEAATAEAKEPEKQVDPEQAKKKKEKEGVYPECSRSQFLRSSCSLWLVLFLRHKLQKGFISRDQPPKEDEMATMATYFDKLESHTDLEVSIIRTTKINKVLKMIVKLNAIPRDEDFKFRQRAMNILSAWKNVLDSDVPPPSGEKDAKPAANGVTKDDEAAETPKLETEEEKELETKTTQEDTPMADVDADKAEAPQSTDAGDKETAEGDKPAEEKSAEEKTVEASA